MNILQNTLVDMSVWSFKASPNSTSEKALAGYVGLMRAEKLSVEAGGGMSNFCHGCFIFWSTLV